MTTRDLAQRVWLAQHEDICAKIEAAGAVVTDPDGFQWIDVQRCGQSLADLHGRTVSVGYARGWL